MVLVVLPTLVHQEFLFSEEVLQTFAQNHHPWLFAFDTRKEKESFEYHLLRFLAPKDNNKNLFSLLDCAESASMALSPQIYDLERRANIFYWDFWRSRHRTTFYLTLPVNDERVAWLQRWKDFIAQMEKRKEPATFFKSSCKSQ